MKDIVYELIPEKPVTNMTIQCFGEKNHKNGNMIKTQYHLFGQVKDHNEINQRELLTTESSSTLTESLNGKNDGR